MNRVEAMCERLDGGCVYDADHHWVVDADGTSEVMSEASFLLRDQAEEIDRLRGALRDIQEVTKGSAALMTKRAMSVDEAVLAGIHAHTIQALTQKDAG